MRSVTAIQTAMAIYARGMGGPARSGPHFALVFLRRQQHQLLWETTMRAAMIAVLSAALISPVLVGCGDKEVSHTESESTNPITGTKTDKDKTTMQRPDGTTYQNSSETKVPSH
jgi:hypothetical protein